MANINELLARAAALRDETQLNSISPERAGGIMYDTLLAMNELWLQQGAALVISKIYASVSAMEADTAPVSDLTGLPLRPGQIVVIASSDSDNGSVYRYNGTSSPSWSLVGEIGNLEPVDSLDSDSTSLPLAAHQGKVLDGKISQLGQKIESIDVDGLSYEKQLIQFSTNRLASPIFPKSEYDTFAKFWLSDDTSYECILFGYSKEEYATIPAGAIQIVSWTSNKSAIQNGILTATTNYCWIFVRRKNDASLTPDDVCLVGSISVGLEETNKRVDSLAEDLDEVASSVSMSVPLVQYSTNRLASPIYPKSQYDLFATLWLSDDSSFQCTLYGSNIGDYSTNPAQATQIVPWTADKSTIQNAILSTSWNYCWLFVKKKNEATLTPDDVHLVGSIVSEVEEIKKHIQTFKERPSSGSEIFTVSVDTAVPGLDGSDTQTFEDDRGRIYIPESYSSYGKPTRLIIHCHGASQNYNNDTPFPKSSSLVTIDYLLAKGYAVLDVNGLPGTHNFFASTCGNPVAYRSYLAAYRWAIKNYNLYKEIFVIGWSAGSIPALQISQIENIPVLACVTYAGIMDFSRGWMLLGGYHGNNSQGPDIKGYLADKFTFAGTRPTLGNVDPCSDEEWDYVVKNWIQFSGWNPFTMNISSTITREQYREIVGVVYGSDVPAWINADYSFESAQKMLLSFKIPQRNGLIEYQTAIEQEKKLFDTCYVYRKVPLKMFHATDDGIAPYRYSQYFYEMSKRGGSTVELRTFNGGGHQPVGSSQSVTVDGVTISTNTLSLEVMDFLQRFEIE